MYEHVALLHLFIPGHCFKSIPTYSCLQTPLLFFIILLYCSLVRLLFLSMISCIFCASFSHQNFVQIPPFELPVIFGSLSSSGMQSMSSSHSIIGAEFAPRHFVGSAERGGFGLSGFGWQVFSSAVTIFIIVVAVSSFLLVPINSCGSLHLIATFAYSFGFSATSSSLCFFSFPQSFSSIFGFVSLFSPIMLLLSIVFSLFGTVSFSFISCHS